MRSPRRRLAGGPPRASLASSRSARARRACSSRTRAAARPGTRRDRHVGPGRARRSERRGSRRRATGPRRGSNPRAPAFFPASPPSPPRAKTSPRGPPAPGASPRASASGGHSTATRRSRSTARGGATRARRRGWRAPTGTASRHPEVRARRWDASRGSAGCRDRGTCRGRRAARSVRQCRPAYPSVLKGQQRDVFRGGLALDDRERKNLGRSSAYCTADSRGTRPGDLGTMSSSPGATYATGERARCIASVPGNGEQTVFAVGTQRLRGNNAVHFVAHDRDRDALVARGVYKHHPEIWDLQPSPTTDTLVATTHGPSSAAPDHGGAVWRVPGDGADASGSASLESVAPFPAAPTPSARAVRALARGRRRGPERARDGVGRSPWRTTETCGCSSWTRARDRRWRSSPRARASTPTATAETRRSRRYARRRRYAARGTRTPRTRSRWSRHLQRARTACVYTTRAQCASRSRFPIPRRPDARGAVSRTSSTTRGARTARLTARRRRGARGTCGARRRRRASSPGTSTGCAACA